MPYLVSGQVVPEEIIQQEAQRICRDLAFQSIADPARREKDLRDAAVQCAINQILIRQAAARDPRPIDPAGLDRAVAEQKAKFHCRTAQDERQLRQFLELQFRDMRIRQEMTADAQRPSAQEVEAFYNQHIENFRIPTMFRAAHIVREVNELQSEEEARAGIEAAPAELEGGAPFGEVADRHSDCKGNGGHLGEFPAGFMVEDFERAIDALEPGQRTGIFTTRFGFHIAQLHGKRPSVLAPLAEICDKIEPALWMQRRHELYLQGVKKLRAGADIRFVPETEEEAVQHGS